MLWLAISTGFFLLLVIGFIYGVVKAVRYVIKAENERVKDADSRPIVYTPARRIFDSGTSQRFTNPTQEPK